MIGIIFTHGATSEQVIRAMHDITDLNPGIVLSLTELSGRLAILYDYTTISCAVTDKNHIPIETISYLMENPDIILKVEEVA